MKLRHFNIMRLLYCLVLSLPFVAILSRVIYVQSNKNAYQSYESSYVSQKIVANPDTLIEDTQYTLKYKDYTGITVYSYAYGFKSINIDLETMFGASYQDITHFGILTYYNHQNRIYAVLDNDINNRLYSNYYDIEDTPEIWFISNGNQIQISGVYNTFDLVINVYSNDTLDNVFEYSVNNFIDDNNFGRVNLFEWTTDLFFDDNQVNNMYVHFVNWYLNYVLLMSTTYILFLVLMWFVNYSRRLLERGMNYDW